MALPSSALRAVAISVRVMLLFAALSQAGLPKLHDIGRIVHRSTAQFLHDHDVRQSFGLL